MNFDVSPYMYLSRPGLLTLKKKLNARETMTFHEYLIAYIKMLRDPKADLADISDFLLEHLQQVTEDAATRDWPSVRRWSQATFDAVEGGSAVWQDRYGLQVERLRHAILAIRPPNQNSVAPNERRDIPCKDYNSPGGCNSSKSHPGRTVNFVHVCSQCFGPEDRSPHPAYTCPRRLTAPHHNTGASLQRSVQQAPKNGLLASHQAPRNVRPILGDNPAQ